MRILSILSLILFAGAASAETKIATFAGGCFWCLEKPFESLDGVSAVISGYAGGHLKNPTYRQVASGESGHLEVVQVHYDPAVISYHKLVDTFWRQIDPTDAGGSFVDRGEQYSSAIFYHDDEQKAIAEQALANLKEMKVFEKEIATKIRKLDIFYEAEEYHQDYYKKNKLRYTYYRHRSGRDQFITKAWKDVGTIIEKKQE
jgi:peptide methionine sulfoxide reductase msrA/msrB